MKVEDTLIFGWRKKKIREKAFFSLEGNKNIVEYIRIHIII